MNKKSSASGSGSGFLSLDPNNYGGSAKTEQDDGLDLPLLELDLSFLSESTLAPVEEMDAEVYANGTLQVEQKAESEVDTNMDTDTAMASTVTLSSHHRSTPRVERYDKTDVDIDTSLADTSLSLYSEPSFSLGSRSRCCEDLTFTSTGNSFAINIIEPSFVADGPSESVLSPQKNGMSMKGSRKILGDLLDFRFHRAHSLKGMVEAHDLSSDSECPTPKPIYTALKVSPSLDTVVLEEDEEARWADEVKEILGKISASPNLDYGGAGNGVFNDSNAENVVPQVVWVPAA
jgi:hypothetical protein